MIYGEFAKSQAEAEYPELWDGLVGAWSPCLSPRGGTVLRDLSGRGNHGTLTNMDAATDWVVSGGRQALDFDGSNDVVEIANNDAINFSGEFTLIVWYSSASASGLGSSDVLISKRLLPTYNYLLYFSSGKPLIYMDGVSPASLICANAATNSTLQFVCVTYASGARSIRLNGNSPTTDSPTGTPTTNTGKLHIGADLGGAFAFPGQVYEAKMFRSVLSQNLVSLEYRLGPGGWATPRRRRWNYATAQTAIPYWVFARKDARLIGGGVT